MTAEELETAVNKLIAEANEDSEQAKKAYEREVLSARFAALANRTYRSDVLERALAALQTDYDARVRKIQSELDESLEALYAEGEEPSGGDEGPTEAPYEVDYSLPYRERYIIVKNYYMSLPDRNAAIDALEADETAKAYLGDYYTYLMELLLLM